jgi:hypothetical protein
MFPPLKNDCCLQSGDRGSDNLCPPFSEHCVVQQAVAKAAGINIPIQSTHNRMTIPFQSTHNRVTVPIQRTHDRMTIPIQSAHYRMTIPIQMSHNRNTFLFWCGFRYYNNTALCSRVTGEAKICRLPLVSTRRFSRRWPRLQEWLPRWGCRWGHSAPMQATHRWAAPMQATYRCALCVF